MPEHVHPSLRDPITHGGQLAPGLRAACGSYAQAGPCSQAGLSGRAELFGGMAADLAQAVGALVDEIADLEIDEDLLHPASGSVGDSEEEEAVQAAAPAPAPAAAANRGRGRSAKGAGAPGKGRGGKAWPAAAAAGQKYPWVDASTHTFAPRAEYAGKEAWEPARKLWDLNYKSPPHEIFALVDAPDSEYELRAVNSERYRTYAR